MLKSKEFIRGRVPLLILLFISATGCADIQFKQARPAPTTGGDTIPEPEPRDPRFCLEMRDKKWKPLTLAQVDQTLNEVFWLEAPQRQALFNAISGKHQGFTPYTQSISQEILSRPQGLRYEATKMEVYARACKETSRPDLKSGDIVKLQEIFLCEDLSPQDQEALEAAVNQLSMTASNTIDQQKRAHLLCTILATTPEAIAEILL